MTPTLLCLHGMACSGAVWSRFAAAWDGPIEAPDLAGHGQAERLDTYGVAAYAAEIRSRFADLLATPQDVVLVGHSMGGAVALEIAGDIDVGGVLAVGIKTVWADEERTGMQSVADKGIRWFDAEEDAETWFLKVSGMYGLVDTGSDVARSGVVSEDGRWRLRADPETYRAGGPPPIADQLARISCPVRLGRGVNDDMVPMEQVEPYEPTPLVVANSGHSPHVENPEAMVDAVRELMS